MGKLILILGGARSGKSSHAEELAAEKGGRIAYIATAQALDEEMQTRIHNHQANRPATWITLEYSMNVAEQTRQHGGEYDVILLDCLTLLMTNVLMAHTADIDNPDAEAVTAAGVAECERLLDLIARDNGTWIVVTNEVGLGLVPPYPAGRVYRDLLGLVNKRFAAQADEVFFMAAGLPLRLK
jgi:adenosylcobinamide kinase/adenosylcobinamide-phosphate guanylyltransferase